MSFLAKVSPAANTLTKLFTCPDSQVASFALNILNKGAMAATVEAMVVFEEDLSVKTITIDDTGSGLTMVPALTVVKDVNGVIPSTTATLTIGAMCLGEIGISSPGSGYTVGQILTLTIPGTLSSVKATLLIESVDVDGGVTAVSIQEKGTYTAVSTNATPAGSGVAVSSGTGTGVACSAPKWGIKTINVTNSGNGYGTTPTISVVGAAGTAWTGSLTVNMEQKVEADDSILYNELAGYETLVRRHLTLGPGQSLYVKSSALGVNFHINGYKHIA